MTATVNDQSITITDESLTVSESVGIYECDFTFDASWDTWNKTAVFEGAGETIEMIVVDNKAQIPWEVLKEAGWIKIGVYGTKGGEIKPTIWSDQIYVVAGTVPGSVEVTPTPSIYAQILDLANDAKDIAEDAQDTADDVASDWASVSATATTLSAGSPATVTFADNTFTFGIPKGAKGDTGATGSTGATPDFSIGTVSTLETGQSATATITGTAAAPVLNLGLPKGNKGDNGDVANVADAYSTSATYAVGDYCIYSSQLYRCTTAITTAEAWTAAHWTAVQLGDDTSDLRSAFNLDIISQKSCYEHLEQGGFLSNGLNDSLSSADHGKRLRTPSYFRTDEYEHIILLKSNINADLQYSVSFYTANDYTTPRKGVTDWKDLSVPFNAPSEALYYRILLKRNDGALITPDDVPIVYVALKASLTNMLDSNQINLPDLLTYGWVDGEYIKNQDGTVGTSSTYHRSDYINVPAQAFGLTASNETFDVYYNAWYDENKEFISNFRYERGTTVLLVPPSNAKYMRLSCNRNVTLTFNEFLYSLHELQANTRDLLWEQKIRSAFMPGWSHTGSGTYRKDNRYRSTIISPLYADRDLLIGVDSNHSIAYQFYDGYETGETHLISTSGWVTSFAVPKGTYFCITMRDLPDNTTEADETTADAVMCADMTPVNQQIAQLSKAIDELESRFPSSEIGNNYTLNNMLQRKDIKYELLGQLSYAQSFCIYDGKYYSINGTNIAEQDATFTALRNVALTTGHGNSLQLGHNGKAYASGWNDNTIYIVDLATLTVTGTIALPTTGYTTCAVDDINEIVYIFQRDSYPDTETAYNFIAYDYGNSQELYRRKTQPFAAMQACDFVNGSIIVLNGLGTTSAPNYCYVYNTSGDIIGEYVFGFMSSTEPEGVCYNRDTHELYISAVNKNLYKITQ